MRTDNGRAMLQVILSVLVAASSASANLFVINSGATELLYFDLNAGLAGPFVIGDASDGLVNPLGLAINTTGAYVSDTSLDQIFHFSTSGGVSLFADAGDGLNQPAGLAFHPNGDLYVSSTATNQILRFDPLGNVSVFADAGDGINRPAFLDFDSANNLYVSQASLVDLGGGVFQIKSNILRIDPAGTAILFADETNGLGLANAGDIAVNNDDELLVSTGTDIFLYDQPGGAPSIYRAAGTDFLFAFGLAYDPSLGALFFSGGFDNRIYIAPEAGGTFPVLDFADGLNLPLILRIHVIPEPGTFWLVGLAGLTALGPTVLRRRRGNTLATPVE